MDDWLFRLVLAELKFISVSLTIIVVCWVLSIQQHQTKKLLTECNQWYSWEFLVGVLYAAQFSKSWSYFRTKNVISQANFQIWPMFTCMSAELAMLSLLRLECQRIEQISLGRGHVPTFPGNVVFWHCINFYRSGGNCQVKSMLHEHWALIFV